MKFAAIAILTAAALLLTACDRPAVAKQETVNDRVDISEGSRQEIAKLHALRDSLDAKAKAKGSKQVEADKVAASDEK